MMATRNIVLLLLSITVVAQIVLYTDPLGTFRYPFAEQEVIEAVTAFAVSGSDSGHLNLLSQEFSAALEEPSVVVEDTTNTKNLRRGFLFPKQGEHASARVLSATNEGGQTKGENPIKLVTEGIKRGNQSSNLDKYDTTGDSVNGEDAIDVDDNEGKLAKSFDASDQASETLDTKQEQQHTESSGKITKKGPSLLGTDKHNDPTPADARLRQLKDQLIQAKGNVNGAVETCRESFHRFDRYLNFSNPLIAKNFDPNACGWAYGMNIFDLVQWKKQNITEVYHNWQKLNHDRRLWKLGTLPPGLITFWKRTFPLHRSWHVLGLGYNPNTNQKEIERAAVIHYNGNMKPWLEITIPKFRGYWTKYVDHDLVYLRECNINP